MVKSLKFLSLPVFLTFFLVSCSSEYSSDGGLDLSKRTFYNEFMACTAGPDYSPTSMTEMIADWHKLISTEDLMGAWGYAPTSEDMSNGWWELQWTSKEAADTAWAAWLANEAAAEWTQKYSSVLQCNNEGRGKFTGVFPIEAEEFGALPSSGYFLAAAWLCKFNEGSGYTDAVAFLPGFTSAVRSSEGYADTSYHFGNYFSVNNPDADFLWVDFANSRESMDQAVAAFAADVESTQFPIFSEFATCGDAPDVYDGWTLYDSENKAYMPSFE
jgi:hypothetical protein